MVTGAALDPRGYLPGEGDARGTSTGGVPRVNFNPGGETQGYLERGGGNARGGLQPEGSPRGRATPRGIRG